MTERESGRQSYNLWRTDEIQTLREYADTETVAEIAIRLGRSPKSVIHKRASLRHMIEKEDGISGVRPWTEADDQIVVDNVGSIGVELIAEQLGRSVSAVISRCHVLAVSYFSRDAIKRVRRWKPEEDATVDDYLGSIPTDQLAKRLGRTTKSLYHRASDLGMSSYTHHGYLTINDIAQMQDTTWHNVRKWIAEGKIPSAKKIGRFWRIDWDGRAPLIA